MPSSTDAQHIVFSPEEVERWNREHEPDDQMAPWVCAIGGYAMLQEGNAELAAQWWLRFGQRRHPAVRGGPYLARHAHLLRTQMHYGFLWWGNPNGWVYRWPAKWEARLGEEMLHRLTKTKMLTTRDQAMIEALRRDEVEP